MNYPLGRDPLGLYWKHKISWTGTLLVYMAYQVRRKKGDHVADAMVIAGTALSIGGIWAPEIRATMVGAALGSAAAPVAVVAIAAYATGGVIAFAAADPEDEGWYGAEALKEYYHDPLGTTRDIIVEEVTDPAITYLQKEIWEKQIVEPVTGWVARRERELIQAKKDLETGLKKYWALTSPF